MNLSKTPPAITKLYRDIVNEEIFRDVRTQIALTMLQGKPDIVRATDDTQLELILEAFRFADNFLAAAVGVFEAEQETADSEGGRK